MAATPVDRRSVGDALGLGDALDSVELRARRQALHLSQAGLARALGVATNTVARWERAELRIGVPSRVSATMARLETDPFGSGNLRTRLLSRRRHNLPAQLPALIGRDVSVAELRQRVLETGLLTLTGTGGCGKTRLALEVGLELVEAFPDGVWLVDLAPVTDASLVVQAVATVLGVRESVDEPIVDMLVQSLERRQVLLLLDNCEHLVDAVANLAERFLRECSDVRMLATSREPLRVHGEITWRVPSLAFPDLRLSPTLDEVARFPAVRLFVAHAQAVYRGFELTAENARVVGEICARLDGMPLAIELAAAMIRMLGVGEVCDRLNSCFSLLVSGARTAPSRHRTLQATLDWSYQLLTSAEQVVFRRLAVFVGGCTLEAVEAVCSGAPIEQGNLLEILTGLVDKSLVIRTEVDGRARFGQLETVRQYSQQKLRGSGEEASEQRQHALWCLTLADKAAPHMQTSEERRWLSRLETDRDNLRAALAWCATRDGAASELGLRIVDVLGHVWFNAQQQTEGRYWVERILEIDRGSASAVRVRVLNWGAAFAAPQGDMQRSDELANEALLLSRELEYWAGAGVALSRLGTNADTRGMHDLGVGLLEEGLRMAGRSGDEFSIYCACYKLSNALLVDMKLDRATTLIEDNVALATRRGDQWGTAQAVHQLGLVAEAREDYGRAAELLEHSLLLWNAIGAKRGPHFALLRLGRVALVQGDSERARKQIGESLRLCRAAWNTRQIVKCLEALASVAALTGQPTRAATLFGAAAVLGERVAMPVVVGDRIYALGLAAAQDQLGNDAFDRAWTAGRALPLEQALSEAEELVAPRVCLDDTNLASASEAAGPVSKRANSRKPGHLTTRQTEVLRLVAEGKTDRQIAAELVLSEKTVGRHLEDIFARLGVSSRAAATVVAVRKGLA